MTGLGEANRRDFVRAAGWAGVAAAVGARAQDAAPAAPAPAGPKIKLGLIGCGGRGIWIAKLFQEHGGYELAAGADYFQDRVDTLGKECGVPADRRFTGLSGYKRLLDLKLDAVAIESPPYFHPRQAMDAVDAGLHVYCAKPIAVDVPGCKLFEEAGRKATEKKRCVLVDFQSRANAFYQEALKRVHEGAIGDLVFGEATYHAGRLGAKGPDGGAEQRLRNWVFDQKLSGDIITEQNIHTLDVMNWIMNHAEPLHAFGTGGRKVRVDVGDCWDYFTLHFQYEKNIGITFSSRQFEGHGTRPEGINNRMFGTLGVLETSYGGEVLIRGKNFYRGGNTGSIYRDGAAANIAAFHQAVTGGLFDNPTVARSVRSNLITILGRTAAYTGKRVTWKDLMASGDALEPDLKGAKA